MLCSRRLVPNPTPKPNRDTNFGSSNHHHSSKSTKPSPREPSKDSKSDDSNSANKYPECGRKSKDPKGLQIHQSSKRNSKQDKPTSSGFWPYRSDKR